MFFPERNVINTINIQEVGNITPFLCCKIYRMPFSLENACKIPEKMNMTGMAYVDEEVQYFILSD